MTLPYDYARCPGTTHPNCQHCRRREPGRSEWQTTIAPPIDVLTGQCGEFIEPAPVMTTNSIFGSERPTITVGTWPKL